MATATALKRSAPKQRTPANSESYHSRSRSWTRPTLVEICVGLEINGYLPAEI